MTRSKLFLSSNSGTQLVTAARANVKTGLAVYLAGLVQQNLLSTIGQFLEPITKSFFYVTASGGLNSYIYITVNSPNLITHTHTHITHI